MLEIREGVERDEGDEKVEEDGYVVAAGRWTGVDGPLMVLVLVLVTSL